MVPDSNWRPRVSEPGGKEKKKKKSTVSSGLGFGEPLALGRICHAVAFLRGFPGIRDSGCGLPTVA